MRKVKKRPTAPSTRRKPGPKPGAGYKSPVWIDQAKQLYADGLSLRDVGRVVGRSGIIVGRHLTRAGVTLRSSARAITFDVDKAIELAATDTIVDIGTKLGVDPRLIREHLRRAGVRARDGRSRNGIADLLDVHGINGGDVRAWAASHGIECARFGTPRRPVIDAYLAAHQTESTTTRKEPAA